MRSGAVVVAFAAVASAFAQEWQAGLARAVTTPKEPVWMAGFGSRTKPSEGVRQDLYVKALALKDSAGNTFVIVSADIVGFPRAITEEISKRSGVPRDRLVLAASHTHSAPVMGLLDRPSYQLAPPYAEASRRYTAMFIDRTVEVIRKSIENLQPATLAFGQSVAGFAVNRRRVGARRNLPGPVDQDVPVLAVRAPDGKLRAVVAGYACHATVLSDYYINADWPGYFKEEFERANPGVEALYVLGCGADANALPRNKVELAQTYGRIMAAAVGEAVHGKMAPVRGPLAAARDVVDIPFGPPPSRAELQELLKHSNKTQRNAARHRLDLLERDGKFPESYPYEISVWQFGGLKWIVLSSEVVVDYSLRLKGAYGWNNTWVSAYANDFCGYIPSLRVLKEGGYEGGDAMPSVGHPGPWGERVEELIVSKVEELVRKTSR